LEQKQWKDAIKAEIKAMRETAEAFIELRDAIQLSHDMTRKQANRLCMQYFSAALEKDDMEENTHG
jgi:hypothetical protein